MENKKKPKKKKHKTIDVSNEIVERKVKSNPPYGIIEKKK